MEGGEPLQSRWTPAAFEALLDEAGFATVEHATEQDLHKRYFEGLPSPAAAGLIAGMVWLGTELGWSGGFALAVVFVMTASAGALMVSRFAYTSFKEIRINERISFSYALTLPLILIMVFINPPLVLFLLALVYATSGPLFSLWRRQKRANRRAAVASSEQREI